MKILMRADGGQSIGMGHIMRMLVLAEEFKKNNHDVIFISKDDGSSKYKAGLNKIIENGFHLECIDENESVKGIIELQKYHKADLIITDTYDVNERYFHVLKPYFKIAGYIDDINKCYMNVDFIINQNFNAEKINYSKNVNHDTKLFLGLRYCMLREEFRKAYKEKIQRTSVNDILLTLGGMDDCNNTIKVLNVLKNFKQNIHVVLGKAFKKEVISEVYALSKEYKNIIPYENAHMAELMKRCDIAVSACGSTIYELCALSVPVIGIIVADNQIQSAQQMKEKGIIADTIFINDFDEKIFLNSVKHLIYDNTFRTNLQNNQSKIVDLNGAEKLAQNIEKIYAEYGENN